MPEMMFYQMFEKFLCKAKHIPGGGVHAGCNEAK